MYFLKTYSNNIFSIYFRIYSFKKYLRAYINGDIYPSFWHLAVEPPSYIREVLCMRPSLSITVQVASSAKQTKF